MWGTDWTRTIGMLTYEQGVTPFRDTKRLSGLPRFKSRGNGHQQLLLNDARLHRAKSQVCTRLPAGGRWIRTSGSA